MGNSVEITEVGTDWESGSPIYAFLAPGALVPLEAMPAAPIAAVAVAPVLPYAAAGFILGVGIGLLFLPSRPSYAPGWNINPGSGWTVEFDCPDAPPGNEAWAYEGGFGSVGVVNFSLCEEVLSPGWGVGVAPDPEDPALDLNRIYLHHVLSTGPLQLGHPRQGWLYDGGMDQGRTARLFYTPVAIPARPAVLVPDGVPGTRNRPTPAVTVPGTGQPPASRSERVERGFDVIRHEVSPGGNGLRPVVRTAPWKPARPPRKNEREGKAKGIGFRIAQFMDVVSESAEVVDAAFGCLDEKTQKRWSKGREERAGDQMGQYGLSGADWKLQALWHNWHKLDVGCAAANIIRNEIEDRIYGKAFGALDDLRPRNLRRTLERRKRNK